MAPSASAASHKSASALCTLRIQVLAARGLAAKDRNGKSDPFVVVSLPGSAVATVEHHEDHHRTTPVKPKTLEPTWKPNEATFDFPVLPDWFGPNYAAVASDEIDSDLVKAAIQNVVVQPAGAGSDTGLTDDRDLLSTSPGRTRPKLAFRSTSARKISRGATKILIAPVKLGAAGARVVGRQMPRPMRMRKRNGLAAGLPVAMTTDSLATPSSSLITNSTRAPRGSIQLDASNGMVSTLEFVIWDKDKFSGDDYMGECSLIVPQWCREGQVEWSKAQPVWLPVESSRPDAKISGELQIKVGFVPLERAAAAATPTESGPRSWNVEETYNRLVLATLGTTGAAVRAIPASQSVGTTGASEAFVDDGLSSDSEDEMDDEDDDDEDEDDALVSMDEDTGSTASDLNDEELDSETDDEAMYDQHYQSIAGVPTAAGTAASTAPTATSTPAAEGLAPPSASQPQGGKYRRMFLRGKSFKSANTSGTSTPVTPSGSNFDPSRPATPLDMSSDAGPASNRSRRRLPGVRRRKKTSATDNATGEVDGLLSAAPEKRRGKKRGGRAARKKGEFAFKAELGMDIVGIVMMEVKGASNLPRWSNATRTGFDMDPFTIISFGQKIFRTRVARHTLNPVWNEKLLFHVRRHETNFQTKFLIYDWDRMSSNDYVGGAQVAVADLVDAAPKPDPKTGLYSPEQAGVDNMKQFDLPLSRIEKDEIVKFKGSSKVPTITIQAKFTPYDALRQRFWRQLAQQFDTNDSGTLSRLELSSMLDSLGSTLSTKTLDSFFHDVSKNPEEDELTFDEAIIALEAEVKKPWSQKRKATASSAAFNTGPPTPSNLGGVGDIGSDVNQEFDFGGSNAPPPVTDGTGPVAPTQNAGDNEPMNRLLPGARPPNAGGMRSMDRDLSALSLSSSTSTASTADARSSRAGSQSKGTKPKGRSSSGSSSGMLSTSPTPPLITIEGDGSSFDEAQPVERVVRLQSCPLCHMPRLQKKGEMDIITHLAVCASQDWRRVESLTVRNYVTASQAQRKWYTKVVNKISQGNYQLGANSANIIVQDRRSGELMEEKMQVYVRLGIRLLYQGARSRMEGARVKRMLKNMSVKQGVKFDSPSSAREIAGFIAFHNLDVDEILDPLESFETFNQFFFRKLKPDARPNDEPGNAERLVSGADCRMMAFATISEATRIWIKGRDFTVERLLGDADKDVEAIDTYQNGGSLAIFRLAPQDYHRFHCPADATVGKFTWIEGQYYTVNPMAIRSAIDVYGENVRVVVPFHSQPFGTFYAVCIGAMMVGSTVLTVKEGQRVKRGQEFGYFKFGGSTIVLVFQRGRMQFDDDILNNSRAAIETLVRVGMGIGRAQEPIS
ncbi:hypothetical protein BCV70DRAFT_156823 [Testicularia cyperi]|uniref:Phosphatidylserine decarboxylase proenzyme 2 n=1 Tax=Testicularia cyperi TaxID=1882483 RepID=A0A317XYH1_9BASI|nr:hypothetical protein BCV70DRAFT_156823 [Testicularia cyperi]